MISIEPLLINDKEAAEMCGIHRATWYRRNSAKLVPAPVRIGSTVRWNQQELKQWISCGCPNRDKWEAMRDKVMKKG
jgi:Predicted transcriptional regulator